MSTPNHPTGGQPPHQPPGAPPVPPAWRPGHAPEYPPSQVLGQSGYGPQGGQPAYGYPPPSRQAPPQPPQVPHQQPYVAYPQQGQIQQPHGAMPQSPPAPVEEKKRGSGCLITVLVFLTLITLGAGTGAWFFIGFGKGEAVWSLPYSGGDPDRQNYLSTWFTDTSVIRAQQDGISALDPATGERQWGTGVPGEGTVVCAASAVTSQNIAVLVAGRPSSCDTVFAVDLATGKVRWTLPVEASDEPPSLAVSGGAVVVEDEGAYRLKDGSKAWSVADLPRKDGCTAGTFVGGPKLVRSYGCPTAKDEFDDVVKARYTISEVDPASGEARWTYTAQAEDVDVPSDFDGEIVSTSPIIVREAPKSYRVLSEGGEPRGVIELDGRLSLGEGLVFLGGSPSSATAVQGDTLLVEQRLNNDGALYAYDMDSGDELWSTKKSNEDVQYDIVRGTEDSLKAVKYESGTFDLGDKNPFSLVTFDPATGDEEEVQEFGGVGDTLGVWAVPYVHHDRLFLASVSNKSWMRALQDFGGFGESHDYSLVALQP